MTTLVALTPRFAVLFVTTGVTVAICTAVALLAPLLVTIAVRLPATRPVRLVTVREVDVAAVTLPVAPLLNFTVSLAAVAEKPTPLIVRLAALAACVAVLAVTTGVTFATSSEALLTPLTATDAVNLPAVNPFKLVTVNTVAVAVVTVPVAPPLNVTLSLAAVVEKPAPLMVKLVAFAARLAVLSVTTGPTVATCTAVPLVSLSTFTDAVSAPSLSPVRLVTFNCVFVALLTVPVTPPLKVTLS